MALTIPPPTSFLTTAEPNIGVLSMVTECTIAQAAKILDMSEGCVNELLRDETILSRQINGERLVQMDSLLAFEMEYREGLETLAEITRLSQEMGFYDD